MLSKSKCSDYIDSLVQMGILTLTRDKMGRERVELKVPLEELLREGIEREGAKPLEKEEEFPQWMSLLLSRTAVRQKEVFFSKEDLEGVASIFMSLICLTYGDDALAASKKLLMNAERNTSAARN